MRSKIAGSDGSSIFNFFKNHYTVFPSGYTNFYSHQYCTRIHFSPLPCQQLLFLIFLNSLPNRCEVIFPYGFDLHFPDDWWYWASFHVPVDHLHSLLAKMSIQVFSPLFNQVVYFFDVELYDICSCFLNQVGKNWNCKQINSVFYICLWSYFYWCPLCLHVDSSYWLVYLHFSLKDSF